MLRGKTILAAAVMAAAVIVGYVSQTEARRSEESVTTSLKRGNLQTSTFYKTTFEKKKYKKKKRAARADRLKKKYKTARRAKKSRIAVRAGKHHRGSKTILASVRSHARVHGVPVSVALALVGQESGFNPRARGSAGEIGLMQLKCSTARGMGYRGSCGGLYNVSTNLSYGMRYLKMALRRGSVAYYNAGIYAKRLPAAAKRYARSVQARI
jgi:soluble lytic murein transglycosylase-like protein